MGNFDHSWILRRSSPLWRMRSLQQPPVVEAGLRVHQAKFMHGGIFCFILSRKIWTWNETHLITLSPSQSARTIIIILKTWVGLWPWKKGPKYGLQEARTARCKKQGHFYPKREEFRLPLLFLNNNDPVFYTLLFSGPYFGPDFFWGSQTDPCFQNKNSGPRLTGRLGLLEFVCDCVQK